MTASAKKSIAVAAVCAAVITGVSIIGNYAAIGLATPARRLAMLAALPAVPGDILAGFLGIGHGPDGFPTQDDMVPYVLTLLLWFGLFYFLFKWRYGGTSDR